MARFIDSYEVAKKRLPYYAFGDIAKWRSPLCAFLSDPARKKRVPEEILARVAIQDIS
jgi:hypothetical protein